MTHELVTTDQAPAPIGPYSQAVRVGKTLYCSGQIALDPQSGNLVDGDVSAQTEQVDEESWRRASRSRFDFDDVVKTTIFLIDMNDFAAVNAVYGRTFDADQTRPLNRRCCRIFPATPASKSTVSRASEVLAP